MILKYITLMLISIVKMILKTLILKLVLMVVPLLLCLLKMERKRLLLLELKEMYL